MQRFKRPSVAGIAKLATISAFALASSAIAHDRKNRIEIRLKSYNEVPAVSSPAAGRFEATYDEVSGAISYELSYSGLEGEVRQAHIHFGQQGVNGGIMVWLCQSATPFIDPAALAPQCVGPNAGTVRGLIQSPNVLAVTAQGIDKEDFDEFVKAIRVGAAYVNVHSTRFPGGELRGQLRGQHGDRD
jgi:hypothetical protein